MDIDCQKVIQVMGRRCNWEQNVPVPDDEKLSFALISARLSENRTYLGMEELRNSRYLSKENNSY